MNYDFYLFNGHGNGDVGAVGNGLKEIDEAYDIAEGIYQLLKNKYKIHRNSKSQNNYQDFLLPGNTYNYKFGYTIHINAGGGTGSEIFTPCNEKELTLDFNILKRLENWGFKNRGVKTRDYNTEKTMMRTNGVRLSGVDYYKEIREAWSYGVSGGIIEVFFIDSITDVELYKKIKQTIIKVIAEEIDKYLGGDGKLQSNVATVTPVTQPTNKVKYRVIAGSFSELKNAENQVKKLKEKGFDCFIEKV